MARGSVLDELQRPSFVKLRPNLWAVVFRIMKLVVARHLLREARAQGRLVEGGRVYESTSGLMGLGLAYACREMGHPLTLVTDAVVDSGFRAHLEALGAEVQVVEEAAAAGGLQAARIARLKALLAKDRSGYWACQYHNPAGPLAFDSVAELIGRRMGKVDYLVTAVGTGCSGTGITRGLRKRGHAAQWIAVDTHNSVLFGHEDGHRDLRGLGNSIIPRNLGYRLVDEVHWVTCGEAIGMAEAMLRDFLLDVGPTSGAACLAACWIAGENPRKNVAFVCPDTGERYRATHFNPSWRTAKGIKPGSIPSSPVAVDRPDLTPETWSRLSWRRRSRRSLSGASSI